MARLARILLLFGSVALSANLFATTYYIDYSSGSDSSNGTSKASPWQHAPGMTGCAASCAAASPKPGDSVILKGGVTWPNPALGWDWTWSGSSSTAPQGCTGTGCIYIGVDQTWYTGSAWARPILNAGGTAVATTAAGQNVIFRCYCNYVQIDNIELTGLYWTGNPSYGSSVNFVIPSGSPGIGANVEVEHIYIHGWSHNTYASGTSEHTCALVGDTGIPNNNVNSWFHDSVVSGADTAENSCAAVFGGPPYISNNVFEYLTSCMIVNGSVAIHDNICQNLMSSFDPTAHLNGLENNASYSIAIYNNVFRHMASGALTIWSAPDQGYTSYIFNNVVYDTDVSNILDLAPPVANNGCPQNSSYCLQGGTEIVFNNTIECGPDSNPNAVCAANISAAAAAVTLQNNHFITNAGSYWSTNGVTPTLVKNILQTKSTANGQGYNSAQTYGFSPTMPYSQDATPGQGATASALCAASGAPASVCSNDSSYGVTYNQSNHTVSWPGRSSNAWNSPPDVGGYSFSSGPQPPQNLQAVVN
jgi:hypothetical protein